MSQIHGITDYRPQTRSTEMRFLVGLVIGAGIGILIAPASGEETRARITEKVDANAREKARKIGARAGEMAYEELKKTI
jgi:gas vesicle protein